MVAAAEAFRPPLLAVPRIRDPEVARTLEGLVLAGASSGSLVGLSLAAGRLQGAVATVAAVGHLAVVAPMAGEAFRRHVDADEQPLIVGLLSALATLALLITATQAAPGALGA